MIDYIANQVAFPQIDVRERLSVSTGYGVAELVVHGDANLIGKTLGDSGLRERDIAVLTLHRGPSVIPNPQADHILEADDRLLCFGKLEEMRSLIPERPKRRPRVKRLPKQPLPPTE
ncbi:cation:proton antiporter regulatory subunit [Microlunatus sp. Gsoil 973]|uniref:cation:proton antiporter regulatory subunit n=1 Tax=Microlunatus sp. Gsoil 973 TaxID=2672569 RepID=UPI00351B26A7